MENPTKEIDACTYDGLLREEVVRLELNPIRKFCWKMRFSGRDNFGKILDDKLETGLISGNCDTSVAVGATDLSSSDVTITFDAMQRNIRQQQEVKIWRAN